jgi:hypothetical protein
VSPFFIERLLSPVVRSHRTSEAKHGVNAKDSPMTQGRVGRDPSVGS